MVSNCKHIIRFCLNLKLRTKMYNKLQNLHCLTYFTTYVQSVRLLLIDKGYQLLNFNS